MLIPHSSFIIVSHQLLDFIRDSVHMMMSTIRFAVVLAAISRTALGFCVHPVVNCPSRWNPAAAAHRVPVSRSWGQLHAGNDGKTDRYAYRDEVLGASERRGNILFAASLLIVAWSFSIPIELRRTHWCFIDSCVQDRSSCYDCLTFGEWVQQVLAFYQSTQVKDWVHFDFSVDPNFIWSVETLT